MIRTRRFVFPLVTVGCLAGLPMVRADEPPSAAFTLTPVQEAALEFRMLESFRKERLPSSDPALEERVAGIGRRLSEVSDRPQLVYDFCVVKGSEPQAYSFPGGTICLTEALVNLFPNEDELAFTIAHELAHAALRHHVTQMRWKVILADGKFSDKHLLETLKSTFGRDSEIEADRFGALYAVRAGYRYTATYEALLRLTGATRAPQEDPAHPPYAERIDALKAFRVELERSLKAFDRGVAALRSRQADDAINDLTLFVQEFPNSFSGRLNLGAAYLARVRSRSGTPLGLAEVLTILPEPGISLRSLFDRGDVERAREHFEQAMRLANPTEVQIRAALGLAYIRLQRLEDARRVLQEALTVAPDDPDLLLCMGNVEFIAGRLDQAEAQYRRALDHNPREKNWPEARKNLALTLEKESQAKAALDIWASLVDDPRIGEEARLHVESLRLR